MYGFLVRLVTIIALCCILPFIASQSAFVTVRPPVGPIRGQDTGKFFSFRGIPYAQAIRWKMPIPAAPWTDPLPAIKQHAACYTQCTMPSLYCPSSQSEDCLYLNVFSSSATNMAANMPVLVYFHTGDYDQGNPLAPGVTPDNMALHRTVVVTVSSRVGILGYLSSKENGLDGNYGYHDQLLALYWVRTNISAFGGNPNSVTLMGSTLLSHLISPLSRGLFHRAIIRSTPMTLGFHTQQTSELMFKDILALAKCSDVECLQSQPPETLVNISVKYRGNIWSTFEDIGAISPNFLWRSGWTWGPVIDNDVIPGNVWDVVTQQKFPNIDLIIGCTWHDAYPALYSLHPEPKMEKDEFMLRLNSLFDKKYITELLDKYTVSDNSTQNMRHLGNLFSDYLFRYGNVRLAHLIATTHQHNTIDHHDNSSSNNSHNNNNNNELCDESTYPLDDIISSSSSISSSISSSSLSQIDFTGKIYLYEWGIQQTQPLWQNGEGPCDHPSTACMYSDSGLLFGPWVSPIPISKISAGHAHQQYIVNFLYTGSPNTGPFTLTSAAWEHYDPQSPRYMSFGTINHDYNKKLISFHTKPLNVDPFWEEIGPIIY